MKCVFFTICDLKDNFVEAIIPKLSTRKLGSSSDIDLHHIFIMKNRAYGSKLCNNEFTWCLNEIIFYFDVHHANIHGTYS